MHQYGKSFYFASMVFSQSIAVRVFSLYQFCRYVDDCGDELKPEVGQQKLEELKSVIIGDSNQPADLVFLVNRVLESGVLKKDLLTLIAGAQYEALGKSIESKQDLIHYCYLVAGVVGKMMCPLIGVKNPKAYPYAIDLGIGMQLTNICRDILEDHNNNRHYLWELNKDEAKFDSIQNRKIVLKYLDLADLYYKSAFNGLSYIPLRSRIAIFVASEIYRAIGSKIRKTDHRVFNERIYLSKAEKFLVCLKSSIKFLHPNFWKSRAHERHLHSELNQTLVVLD
jgi:phytoene synthase